MSITFQYNDGGRAAAGYKGVASDCVCRSISIITGKPYQEVYDALNTFAKCKRKANWKQKASSARNGVFKITTRRYLENLGFDWIPTMFVGQGCKVHLRTEELPRARLIVSVTRHLTAVIDGVIHDTHDCARGGSRCFYGYYVQRESRHD